MAHHRHRKRHKPPRAVLQKKRGRVVAKIESISAHAQQHSSDHNVGGPDPHAIAQLHSIVAGLQRQVKGSGAVADGLGHAAVSLQKLQAARGATSGAEAMKLLTEGLDALTSAHHAAKRAGHDWAI